MDSLASECRRGLPTGSREGDMVNVVFGDEAELLEKRMKWG
jgi:hypothetical protein